MLAMNSEPAVDISSTRPSQSARSHIYSFNPRTMIGEKSESSSSIIPVKGSTDEISSCVSTASITPQVTDRRSDKLSRTGSKSSRHTSNLRQPIIELLSSAASSPNNNGKSTSKIDSEDQQHLMERNNSPSLQDLSQFSPNRFLNNSSARSGVVLPADDPSFPVQLEYANENNHHHRRGGGGGGERETIYKTQILHQRTQSDSARDDNNENPIHKLISDVQAICLTDSTPSSDRFPLNESPTPLDNKSRQISTSQKSSHSNNSIKYRNSRAHAHIAVPVLPNKQEPFFKSKSNSNEHLNNGGDATDQVLENGDHSNNNSPSTSHHYIPRPPHKKAPPPPPPPPPSTIIVGDPDHDDVNGELNGSPGNSVQSVGSLLQHASSTPNVTKISATGSHQGLPPKVIAVANKKPARSTSSAHSSKRPLQSRYLIKTECPDGSTTVGGRHDDVTTDEGGESNIEEDTPCDQFPVLKRYHSLRSMGSNEIISITGGVNQVHTPITGTAVPKICGNRGNDGSTMAGTAGGTPSSSALKSSSSASRASPSKVTFNMPEEVPSQRKKSESFKVRNRKGTSSRHSSSPVLSTSSGTTDHESQHGHNEPEGKRHAAEGAESVSRPISFQHRHHSPAHPSSSRNIHSSVSSQTRDKRDIWSPESCAKVHEQFLSQTTYYLNSQLELLHLFQEGKHSWETYREMTLQSLRMTEHGVNFILHEFEKTTESYSTDDYS